VSLVGFESSFSFVLSAHADLVVACAEIELREDTRTGQFIEKFINDWHRKNILHSELI
jgi:hypothetical protein